MGKQFIDMQVWDEVRQRVHIRQKVLRHTPIDKLLDCFISMLAGGRGIVEVNTRVRADPTVQRAFGRQACADQSTISETLSACTATNVEELRAALSAIFRQHSRAMRHDYGQGLNVLDIDMTGMPAGRTGEGVEKGYFPTEKKNRRGRQLGRVLATHSDELVCERLYSGKRQLESCLPELVQAAERVMQLEADTLEAEKTRRLTVLRVDGGGGTAEHIDWMLTRSYRLIVKVRNWRRAKRLAHTVTDWYTDAKLPWREVGWVGQPQPFAQSTRQLAVRHRKANGEWSYAVIVFNLTDEAIAQLLRRVPPGDNIKQAVFNALHFYDLRGGGIETQNRADKQGLALTHRNKRAFAAQEMLVLLAELAHNFIIWVRDELAHLDPRLARYGIVRTVRDVFHIDGWVAFAANGTLAHVTLNPRHPLAAVCQRAFDSAYV